MKDWEMGSRFLNVPSRHIMSESESEFILL